MIATRSLTREISAWPAASRISCKKICSRTLSFNTRTWITGVPRHESRHGRWVRQLDELQTVSGLLQYAELDYAGTNECAIRGCMARGRLSARVVGPWQPLLTLSGSYTLEDNRRDRDDLGRASGACAPRWR